MTSPTTPATVLTTRARVALSIARGMAAAMGNDNVSSLHVLLGLLVEGENAAVSALGHAGVSIAELRSRCERALPRERPEPMQVAVTQTAGEATIVKRAVVVSREAGAAVLGAGALAPGSG